MWPWSRSRNWPTWEKRSLAAAGDVMAVEEEDGDKTAEAATASLINMVDEMGDTIDVWFWGWRGGRYASMIEMMMKTRRKSQKKKQQKDYEIYSRGRTKAKER